MGDLTGSMVGRYKIIQRLGQGGMATVYRALDTRLEREVAIKTIRTDMFPPAVLPDVLARFEREAKALARLDHPNIVRVHDYGEHENVPYLVMAFVTGGSLRERTGRPYSPEEAAALLAPVARALDYAHSMGILHRDIKPANILINAHGVPLLSDFGIAKILDTDNSQALTATGMSIGTPEYMAPEQSSGEKVDARADIYALGVVLFELLSGRRPFEGNTPIDVMIKTRTATIPSFEALGIQVPSEVELIVHRALARETSERYATMGVFAQDLEAIAGPLTVSKSEFKAKTEGPSTSTPPPAQSRTAESFPDSGRTITHPTPLPPSNAGHDSGGTITTPPVPFINQGDATAVVNDRRPASVSQTPIPAPPPPPVRATGPQKPLDLQAPGKRSKRGLPAWAYGVIAFIVIGLIGGAIWGLNQNGDPGVQPLSTNPLVESGPITITIWDGWSDPLESAAYQALLAEFQSAHPGLTIEYTQLGDGDVVAATINGTGPDIFILSSENIGGVAEVLVPLERLGITPDALMGYLTPLAVSGVTWQNQVWGVPLSQKAIAIVYNRDLVTPFDIPQDPMDLNGLVKKALEFRNRTGKPMVCNHGLNSDTSDPYFAAPFFFTVGMPGYVNESGDVFVNTPAGIEAGRLLKAWRLASGPDNLSYEFCKDLFLSGVVGAWWTGPWEKFLFETSEMKLAVARFGKPFVTYGTAVVTRNAEERMHIDQVIEIINFLSLPENQIRMALNAYAIPTSEIAMNSPEMRESPMITSFFLTANQGIPISPSPFTAAQWGPMQEAIRSIWSGEQLPAVALEIAHRKILDVIENLK